MIAVFSTLRLRTLCTFFHGQPHSEVSKLDSFKNSLTATSPIPQSPFSNCHYTQSPIRQLTCRATLSPAVGCHDTSFASRWPPSDVVPRPKYDPNHLERWHTCSDSHSVDTWDGKLLAPAGGGVFPGRWLWSAWHVIFICWCETANWANICCCSASSCSVAEQQLA